MLRSLGTAATLVLLLAGCTGGPMPTPSPTLPSASGDGVLRIGTLFSTGDSAAAGLSAAVNAAVRGIDAAGGVEGAPVEVISRNGGTAGDGTAEASFADLVAHGVDAVIGPSTMEIAAVLQPLAADAGIPLITPAAVGDRPAGMENLFRTVPSLHDQGAFLSTTIGAPRVALLRTGDGAALSAGLADGLTAHEGELVADVTIGADAAADVQQIVAATPDAVVLAAADAGPGTVALITALAASGLAGTALWITGPALTRYDTAAAALEGAHGIQSGAATDSQFVAQVRQEDPGARTLLNAVDAYDATVLVALAAVLAGDDGGPSITATLPAAAAGGIPCHSFGECEDTLNDRPDIVYEGVSGPLAFDDAGDRVSAAYASYEYGADGVPVVAESPTG